MLKILVNAYAVAPDRGSEPGMGWNWCIRLARECELFIITEGEFKEEILRALGDLPQAANMHFFFLPVSARVRKMCWNQGDWRFYLHYAVWQRRALSLARKICAAHPVDIIHQLNMIGFREPGLLWKIKGPGFIWGPIAGMGEVPMAYYKDAPLRVRMQARLKNLVTRCQKRGSARVRKAAERASSVLCATPAEYAFLSARMAGKAVLFNETGASPVPHATTRQAGRTVHALWVGRFLHSKQLGLALRTMALLKDSPLVLDIVGTGPEPLVMHYRKLAENLGLEGKVLWHGQLPHRQVEDMMDRADLFFFTSVYEGTSTVIMEAISHGLPVVCFDTCGFGPLIGSDMGIKVPLRDPERSAADFAAALRNLATDINLREKMSKACCQKAPDLSWEAQAKKMVGIYRQMLKD